MSHTQQVLQVLMTFLMTILPVYRLDTIMDSDRVLVMNQGTVAEFDKPQDLLENRRSLFYALVHSGK